LLRRQYKEAKDLWPPRPCPEKPGASFTVEEKIAFRPYNLLDGRLISPLQITGAIQSEFKVIQWRRGEKPDPALQGKFDLKA
jgi:hypothetical protein